ncbi:uncharacterized protein [Amphiura filiformis]|uniref:uncharacterized protein n=1 Tax=Amphiura filiformis TaxID=82378 RepID=UPI003B21BC6C
MTYRVTSDDYGDAMPLLQVTTAPSERLNFEELRQRQRARIKEETSTDTDGILLERGYDDDIDGEFLLKASAKQKRRTVLVFHDAFFLIIDFLQYYALIMSIALRWPWPYQWLMITKFAFVFNLDIWEVFKMFTPGVYDTAIEGFIDSVHIVIGYRFYFMLWCVGILAVTVIYIGLYISMNYQKRYNLLMQIARLQRIYIILWQVFAIPIGVALGKVFHCTPAGNMDVHNDTACYSAEHMTYMAIAMVIAFFLYILLPIWMLAKIHMQIFSLKSDRHEGYLQLKEAEYGHSLDTIWYLKLYHLFSSFKLFWVYYRPITFFLKLLLIVAYATMLWYPMFQMIIFLVPLVILFIIFLIKRPFRVASFNFQLLINYLCMIILAFMGLFQNSPLNNTVFFQTEYLFSELLAINLAWVLFTGLWFICISLRNFGILCKRYLLWPRMTSRGLDKLDEDTRKYMRAILRGRIVLEKALSTMPLFSPAHEVARQIQVINAYCREAEFLGDPIHDTLWDLLDELIEAHSRIAPTSLFGSSMKSTIGDTAKELLKVLPDFKKRLAQREYDFVLMTPMKRRILLKMYCIGVFMNGKADKARPPLDQSDTVQKLYNPMESLVLKQRTIEGDDGFYEDLNDVTVDMKEMGPAFYRHQKAARTQQNMIVITEAEEEEEEADEEEEEEVPDWMRPGTHLSGISSLYDMDDLDEMMMGIPSRQNSVGSAASRRHRPPSSMSRLSHHSRPSSRASINDDMTSSTPPPPIKEDDESLA